MDKKKGTIYSMIKRYIFLVFMLAVVCLCYAQVPIRHQTATPKDADSTDIAYYSKKKWFQAGATVFGVNMGVWAFDRYIQKGHFAYISINTMRENFRRGFIWDNDFMGTNMFLHPYHGSLYFNAGRANGLNYWESGALALGGSAMWELFMECEYPSTNDIIATPVGGMALGEVLFRTSDLILDDRRTGSSRFGQELAAFLIAPTRGLTRIINGYEGYRMFTWKGYDRDINWEAINEKTLDAQGDHSQAILHAISLRVDLKLKNRFYLTGIGYNYTRDTNYKYFNDVFSKTSEGRIMLTYKF